MNILVIGNGFDLEHGLPTMYKDFLDFIKGISNLVLGEFVNRKYVFEENISKNESINNYVKSFLLKDELFNSDGFNKWKEEKNVKELIELSEKNVWISYFCDKKNDQNRTWIDFESEISEVIQVLDYMRKNRIKRNIDKNEYCDKEKEKCEIEIIKLINRKDNEKISSIYNLSNAEYFEKVIKVLINDLNDLIRCLEIYLEDYVGKIIIEYISPNIKNIKIDKVLSFNYTDTYKKIYTKGDNSIEYNFIHGKADLKKHTIKDMNNMVLGIDEYLKDDLKNKEIDFIEFKKYFQRIYKKTGSEYKKWINEMNRNNTTNNIYFFGHSLDITDKDILKELIMESGFKENNRYKENTKVTIFYYDKKAYASQIANLVKVIGQDELIERVSGVKPTIIFEEKKQSISIELLKEIDNGCKNFMCKYNKENRGFGTAQYVFNENCLSLGIDYNIYFKILGSDYIQIYLSRLLTEQDLYGYKIIDEKDLHTYDINLYEHKFRIKRDDQEIESRENFQEVIEYIVEDIK